MVTVGNLESYDYIFQRYDAWNITDKILAGPWEEGAGF